MEFDHKTVRGVEEDRLSSLPDELIHQILSCLDMKFVVQTCSLSSRWKILWKSMPCLNFRSWEFGSLPKFSKFVTNVLSHHNHQVEVSCVKLNFSGAASQVFVRKIANYAFSHNVQELTISCFPKNHHEFPPCLFSSQSLKHLTLSNPPCSFSPCVTPKTPWDFPALTTLNLSHTTLCNDDSTAKSLDLFSKCVNLKNLTLERFIVKGVEVFDIITPRLSNLMLIDGRHSVVINLNAPQLENLTIVDCSFKHLNAPAGLSSLCYKGCHPLQFSKEGFHSLNKATISLSMYWPLTPYKEEDARMIINMLQELHSARNLILNMDIVECISSFPDLLLHHPSPFSNLICLTIDSYNRDDAYKTKLSTEARNFLLGKSPSAKYIMDLPEAPPTKAMKQKEARAKKKARQAEIESHMKELKALIEQENMVAERKRAKEKANKALQNLMAELQLPMLSLHKLMGQVNEEMQVRVLSKQNIKQIEPERAPIGEAKESHKAEMQMQVGHRLLSEFKICVGEMNDVIKEETTDFSSFCIKKARIMSLLENLSKRERAEAEARYSQQLQETETYCARVAAEIVSSEAIFAYEKVLSDNISTYQGVSSRKRPLASQTHSSSSTMIPTSSTSSTNPVP